LVGYSDPDAAELLVVLDVVRGEEEKVASVVFRYSGWRKPSPAVWSGVTTCYDSCNGL
jgi:hypothetical protein